MIGKCERKQIKKEEKMPKKRHKYTQHSIKKNERHKKTTYNKIAGKKEREQYVIKQIQKN